MCSLRKKKGDVDNIRSQPRIEDSEKRTRERYGNVSLLLLFFLFLLSSFLFSDNVLSSACVGSRPEESGGLEESRYPYISRAAKSRLNARFAQRSATQREKREKGSVNARIPTHENLLPSVPTQNVDSAELTDIKRILNVLLKKKKKKRRQVKK